MSGYFYSLLQREADTAFGFFKCAPKFDGVLIPVAGVVPRSRTLEHFLLASVLWNSFGTREVCFFFNSKNVSILQQFIC